MVAYLILFTLVIYEINTETKKIKVYDYSEETEIEIVCPEGVSSFECVEPRAPKTEISLDDIKDCADNWKMF